MIRRFKKGAASFYIVAFATLILMILALSFTAVIISEVNRTSNDDLSQSAYDSAMAGVEDAKLAFYNYQNCKAKGVKNGKKPNNGGSVACDEIVWYVENGLSDCDMVGHILGRVGEGKEGPVEVKEENVNNNMQQAYTCTTINNSLANYSSYVKNIDVTKLQFDGVSAKDIMKVRISWGTNEKKTDFLRIQPGLFRSRDLPLPPTISFAVLQTSSRFHLSDFDESSGGRTNRGMVYLVPSDSKNNSNNNNYKIAYNGRENVVPESALLNSNSRRKTNVPYVVYCDKNATSQYICSAIIELPKPKGDGVRSDNTFAVVVGNPAMNEDVEYSMEFLCNDGVDCAGQRKINKNTDTGADKEVAFLENVQLEIDSTGKANDLFRRVVTRYKSNSDYALSIMGPLELLGNGDPLVKDFGDGNGSDKSKFVTCEANFFVNIEESNCD